MKMLDYFHFDIAFRWLVYDAFFLLAHMPMLYMATLLSLRRLS